MHIQIENIPDIIAAEGYKFARLVNSDNKTLLPYNRPAEQPKTTAIVERLNNPFLPDGSYKLLCKRTTGGAVDTYIVNKGEPKPAGTQTQIPLEEMRATKSTKQPEESVLSYSKALEVNTELARLQMENEQLKQQLEELEEEEPEQLQESGLLNEKTLMLAVPLVNRLLNILEAAVNKPTATLNNNAQSDRQRAEAAFRAQHPNGDFNSFWQSIQSGEADTTATAQNDY